MFLCPICMDNFTPELDTVSTNCGHVFHRHCLIGWFNRDGSCPSCRGNANRLSTRIYLQYDEEFEEKKETLKLELDSLKTQISAANESKKQEKQELIFQIDILEAQNKKLSDEQELGSVAIASLQSSLEETNKNKEDLVSILEMQKEDTEKMKHEILELKQLVQFYEKLLENNKKMLNVTEKTLSDLIAAYQKEVCVQNIKTAAEFLKEIMKDLDTSEDLGTPKIVETPKKSETPKDFRTSKNFRTPKNFKVQLKPIQNQSQNPHNVIQKSPNDEIDAIMNMILRNDDSKNILKERNDNSVVSFSNIYCLN